jgi:hypothetical protein
LPPRRLNLFLFFLLQEVSGDDDVVDAGVGTTEVNESIVERQEVALESTDDVAAKDSPIDWSDSDDAMADETLGVTVSDEAVLVMADEAVHQLLRLWQKKFLVKFLSAWQMWFVLIAHGT